MFNILSSVKALLALKSLLLLFIKSNSPYAIIQVISISNKINNQARFFEFLSLIRNSCPFGLFLFVVSPLALGIVDPWRPLFSMPLCCGSEMSTAAVG